MLNALRALFFRRKATSIQEQVDTSPIPEPIQENYAWGTLPDSTEEDQYWHHHSESWPQKDLVPATYLELHNACYEAYNANPLAFTIIEITTSFVLGKGVTIAARHPDVQRVLMRFWHDPDNHMDTRVYDLCTELALYGEQFIRFYVNPIDGSVKIRQIDPSIIDKIESDPHDIETTLRFHCITPNSSLLDPAQFEGEWLLAGEDVMQFCINKVSNAKRGKSDLATVLPWLRRYKDWLVDRVRINKYKGVFLWDVQLTGADRKIQEQKRLEYSYPPEPGTVIVHSEREKWTAVKPEIRANDVAEDGRALKLMIAVGAQLPEHYLSDGYYGNRATAAEMGLPTVLKFQRRQHIMKAMLRTILDRVLFEAQKARKLPQEIDTSYDLLFPEIDVADNQTLADAARTIISALTTAKQQGWVSDETAMRLLFQFAGEEMDIHEELARIRLESKEE